MAMTIKALTKNHIGIVLALVLAFTGFPVFGQQGYPASGNGNEREPFFSINAQFSYFPTFIQRELSVRTKPWGLVLAPGYAIQLGMGLKLFNTINTLFDFGLDDPSMSDAMRIAGKIGTRYFDVMYTYKRAFFSEQIIDSRTALSSEEYAKWRFPQDGERLEGKSNVGTLALMVPIITKQYQIGFIWNSINANLAFPSEREIDGQYVAYVDIDRNFNTYGIRVAIDLDGYYHFPLFDGGILGEMKIIAETYLDISWGEVSLSGEAADALGFSDNKISATYLVARINLGLAWEKKISAKRSITYGFGLDFFGAYFQFHFSKKNFEEMVDPAVLGIFARIKLVL